MTREEKAKRYEEALEMARNVLETDLHESGVWAIKKIFPELKESEDEKIRKGMIRFLNSEKAEGIFTYEARQSWIAYLEKQKINTEGDFGRGYDCGYEACLNSHGAEFFEKQKEQKPAEFDEYKIIKKHITEDILSSEVNKRLTECGWYVTDEKPAEWSEEDEEKRDDIVKIIEYSTTIPAYGKTGILKLSKEYKKELTDWLNSLRPKQKVEWSEEDERMRKAIIESLPKYGYLSQTSIKVKDAIVWLEKQKEQKPAEWSEEDEKMRINILNALTPHLVYSVGKGTYTGTSTYKYDDEIRWLKSLKERMKGE